MMRSRLHAGLLAVLGLTLGGLTALALPMSAGADSSVCMGLVIDDGAGTPSVQTVNVAVGTSDLQAMSSAGVTVTQNDSGLVCAINNYPANGLANCLRAKKGQYFYWSYWQGNPDTNTWTYASAGPASHDVTAGQDYVEGWRYQNPGPDNPTAPPPSITPAAAFGCSATATTTSTTSGGHGGDGTGGGGGHGGGSAPDTVATTPPTTQPTTAASSGTVPSHSPGGHATTPTTEPKTPAEPVPPPAVVGTSSTTRDGANGAGTDATVPSATKLAEADTASHGQGGGDPALPIAIVALVIMVLGGLAWFRWRRRPAEE